MIQQDERYMRIALGLAAAAARRGEVPVGALVVKDGKILGWGSNYREAWKDPTAHAEMIAICRAAKRLGSWRLMGCTLYVTLEPCPMCAGAIINARIDRVVFGAVDPKAGYCGTLHDVFEDAALNHHPQARKGVLKEECAQVLKDFFKARRKQKK